VSDNPVTPIATRSAMTPAPRNSATLIRIPPFARSLYAAYQRPLRFCTLGEESYTGKTCLLQPCKTEGRKIRPHGEMRENLQPSLSELTQS
jgi:hypothetical protein